MKMAMEKPRIVYFERIGYDVEVLQPTIESNSIRSVSECLVVCFWLMDCASITFYTDVGASRCQMSSTKGTCLEKEQVGARQGVSMYQKKEKSQLNYERPRRFSFRPPVRVTIMKNEIFQFMLDSGTNFLGFIHSTKPTRGTLTGPSSGAIKSLLIYQLETDGNYRLVKVLACGIEFQNIWSKLHDMEVTLLVQTGSRESRKLVYDLVHVLTCNVRRIIIPHWHMCSDIYTEHFRPLFLRNKVIVVCEARRTRGGNFMTTLFNITWITQATGILSKEQVWTSLYPFYIYITPDGRITYVDSRSQTPGSDDDGENFRLVQILPVPFISQFLFRKTGRKENVPEFGYNRERGIIHVYIFDDSERLTAIKMFRMKCWVSHSWSNRTKYDKSLCKELEPLLDLSGVNRVNMVEDTMLLLSSGDFLSLICWAYRQNWDGDNKTVVYKLFTRFKLADSEYV
ncbi:uncharacterized protein LOC135498994 [Lineus longissimus]|uniref:uncharacterized protein LOC135498994 n=1 Tax=Lineus longissimus TaxID=88925 RepID=UPI00315DF02C